MGGGARDAHAALRARTWWLVDQCLSELAKRRVVPQEVRLLPRGPAPAEFPPLPPETSPTVSARRRARPAPAAAPLPGAGDSESADHSWFEAAGGEQGAAPAPSGGGDEPLADDACWGLGDDGAGEGGAVPPGQGRG